VTQNIRKIISFFLLATFLVATTPDYLLHLLAGHHDSVDCNSSSPEITEQHIHCAALLLVLPAFAHSSAEIPRDHTFLVTPLYLFCPSVEVPGFQATSPGRGPPSVV